MVWPAVDDPLLWLICLHELDILGGESEPDQIQRAAREFFRAVAEPPEKPVAHRLPAGPPRKFAFSPRLTRLIEQAEEARRRAREEEEKARPVLQWVDWEEHFRGVGRELARRGYLERLTRRRWRLTPGGRGWLERIWPGWLIGDIHLAAPPPVTRGVEPGRGFERTKDWQPGPTCTDGEETAHGCGTGARKLRRMLLKTVRQEGWASSLELYLLAVIAYELCEYEAATLYLKRSLSGALEPAYRGEAEKLLRLCEEKQLGPDHLIRRYAQLREERRLSGRFSQSRTYRMHWLRKAQDELGRRMAEA